jgi:hypothetical protein
MSNLVEGQKLRFDIQADPRKGKSAAANLQCRDAMRPPNAAKAPPDGTAYTRYRFEPKYDGK